MRTGFSPGLGVTVRSSTGPQRESSLTVKSVALDETDHRIIKLLLRNGRAPFASIGAEVGLSPHGAADRVRRLQRAGVITGFSATVDSQTLGRSLEALIDVRLMPATDSGHF